MTPTQTPAHITEWHARGEAAGLYFHDDERCPRTLVDCPHLELDCWCNGRPKDHAATWWSRRDGFLVLWEPYDLEPEELTRLHLCAERDGLRLTVSGDSLWNPGSCLRLTFKRAVR